MRVLSRALRLLVAVVGTAGYVLLINNTNQPENIAAFVLPAVALGALVQRWWILVVAFAPLSYGVDGFEEELEALVVVVYIPMAAVSIATGWTAGALVTRRWRRLHGDRNGSRASERAGELGENGQLSVKPDPLKPTDAEWQ